MLQLLINPRHNILPIHFHLLIRHVPQRSMQNRSILREVDLLTPKHGVSQIFNLRLLGNCHQQLQCLFGKEVLAEVKQDFGSISAIFECVAELLEAGWVSLEFLFQHEGFAD
jgi:hypothetical protein